MNPAKRLVIHLLPNAHLDPVWLWDWREGLNEGRITVRAVLDLMDEFPELTFMRGESAIYEHIQKSDPGLFRRIREKIEEGRWDVVGGTVIQPDTNLAATETLCRQYERGLDYFQKHLGVRPTAAWQADSFGHAAGFATILSAFGMNGLAFTRPQQEHFPLDSTAFWWEDSGAARVLCYRQHWKWYCTERENMRAALDETLREAGKLEFSQVAVLFGLGNHGGGPTRRHLREIQEWRGRHPEVEVRFSTLHGFFAALREEIGARRELKVPVVRGEFGYCLRGCYSSVQKFKSLYRRAEAQVADAEITRSIIGAAAGPVESGLDEAWHAIAFNAFHDILPGSSIERAVEEQTAWTGLALHRAHEARFAALNRLAEQIDATVPPAAGPDKPTDVPFLVWNPLPRPYQGQVEVEASLDYRPNWAYQHRAPEIPVAVHGHNGKPVPFQIMQTEHTSLTDLPWRSRVIVPVDIPAFGWTFLRMGWRDKPEAIPVRPLCRVRRGARPQIANAEWSITAEDGALRVRRDGGDFFSSKGGVELRVYEDPWGAWGGMNEETDSYILDRKRETWKLAARELLETGPLRAKLWTRWRGKNSWLDLTFSVSDAPWVHVEGRLLWNERSARLKLILPCRGGLTYDVPGGRVVRAAEGHVPGGRWVTRVLGGKTVGFASDVLSDFDATPSELRVTLARASRYANDQKTSPTEKLWEPAVDCGELKFQFRLFGGGVDPDRVADALLFPPVAGIVPATPGPWKRRGGLGRLAPETVRLLTLEQTAPNLLRVRAQNRGSKPAQAVLTLGENRCPLGKLAPEQIATWELEKEGEAWKSRPVS